LPETKVQEAAMAMERVRHAIEAEKFQQDGKPLDLNITVSIGISVFPADGKVEDELIEKADQALYLAKGEGRNRVVIYEKKESTGS
jgi:diguanylate cyclase (GGDEF)-like protein